MLIWELILIAVSLSADAFAVSMCRGLEMRRVNVRHAIVIALFFGVFQAAMPVIGYYLAMLVADYITEYDHWIAFGLLALLGAKMIYDGIKEGLEEKKLKQATTLPVKDNGAIAPNDGKADNDITDYATAPSSSSRKERLDVKKLLLMSVATSIDALAVGISFAFLKVNLWVAVALIGSVTFALSLIGVFLGHRIGAKFKNKATIAGGCVLILIGLKILLEHLGFISF